MQEVDQRPYSELLFRCTCGGDHFLSFSATKWKDSQSVDIYIADTYRRPRGLRQRLVGAWRFFWCAEYTCSDVGLTTKDLMRIGDWCLAMIRYLTGKSEFQTMVARAEEEP